MGTCCGECLPFNYLPSSCSCLLTAWHRRLRPPPRPPAPSSHSVPVWGSRWRISGCRCHAHPGPRPAVGRRRVGARQVEGEGWGWVPGGVPWVGAAHGHPRDPAPAKLVNAAGGTAATDAPDAALASSSTCRGHGDAHVWDAATPWSCLPLYPISEPVLWEWDPTAQHCRGTPWGPRPASLPSAEGDLGAGVPAGSARSSVRPSHAGAREGSRAGPMEGPQAASGWREAAEPKGYRLAGRLRGLGSAPSAPAPAAGTSPSLPLPASVSPGRQ